MTVERGGAWGKAQPLPADGIIARSDADAASVIASARSRGLAVPPIGLLAGDLCRTVGGIGDERRLHTDEAVTLPVDIAEVEVDGHRTLRRARRRPPFMVARSRVGGDERGVARRWDVAPRGTRATGCSTSSTSTLDLGDRLKARRRLRTGTHVPHPRHHASPSGVCIALDVRQACRRVGRRSPRRRRDRLIAVPRDGRARRHRRLGSARCTPGSSTSRPAPTAGARCPTPSRARTRSRQRRRQRAEPHGPVGHAGHAQAAAASRPRLRRGRDRRTPSATR